MNKVELISRFEGRTAKVMVIGLGYVGLPLACRFAQAGYKTYGMDVNPEKIELLKKGSSYLKTFHSGKVVEALQKGFTPVSNLCCSSEVDAFVICVPTPLTKNREPDVSFVISAVDSLLSHLRVGKLVVLESTSYPGTTEELIKPRLESLGFEVGRDIFLAFSPEREDPGNLEFSTKNIPKLVGGDTPTCLEIAVALYEGAIDKVIPVNSTRVAEMAKLFENIHRAVNIGLVNELKIVSTKMGLDVNEIIAAAATKPFGFGRYEPGPGLGGHCIPIDPFYLTWKAREFDVETSFIELAGRVNRHMPFWVVEQIGLALNTRSKSIKGSSILLVGAAYKKNIDDVRESPALVIARTLLEQGAHVLIHDSLVSFSDITSELNSEFALTSYEFDFDNLDRFDCVVLTTDHDYLDYDKIFSCASVIVDTRGRYRGPSPKLFKA